MALVVADRVKETTTTTGTGAITLAGAEVNFVAFSSVLSDGDTTYYAIVDDSNQDFEVGLGTYATSGNTLTRTTVLASSNSGSAVNLLAGSKEVFINYPAGKSVYLDGSGQLVIGGTAVTSTAAELNILDGVTATTAEINILDGVTATTAELNYVDGVTSNIQTQIDGIPVSGQSDFVAEGAISAGDAVYLKSTGKVVKSQIASDSVGTSAGITGVGSNTSSISICNDPVNDKFVIFYRDNSDGNKGKAVVGTRSGTTVTYGTPVTFYSSALYTSGNNPLSSTYDASNGQVVIAYTDNASNYGRIRAGTVSGTSITFHTELALTEYAFENGICYDPSVDKLIHNYRTLSNQGKAAVITNSGTALTVTTVAAYGSSLDGYTADAVHMEDYPTAGCNALCFNTSGSARIKMAVVNPTTFALTFGSAFTVQDHNGYSGYAWGSQTIAWSKEYQRLLALFENGPSGSYFLNCSLYSASGTNFTRVGGAQVDNSSYSAPYEDFPSVSISPDGLQAAIVYPDNGSSDAGFVRIATTLSASTISLGANRQFDSTNVDFTSLAYNSTGSNFVIAYATGTTTFAGKYAVGTSPIQDNRASVIGFSQNTVSDGQTATVKLLGGVDANQSGLVANSDYYLSSSDGSTLTTSVSGQKIGVAMSSTKILVTARS